MVIACCTRRRSHPTECIDTIGSEQQVNRHLVAFQILELKSEGFRSAKVVADSRTVEEVGVRLERGERAALHLFFFDGDARRRGPDERVRMDSPMLQDLAKPIEVRSDNIPNLPEVTLALLVLI